MGRPKMDILRKKKAVSFRFPRWLIEWLSMQNKSSAKLIEEALIEKHNLQKKEES